MKKVSVILSSYNHQDYLNESINSILNQTYKNFELIVVDDCSTDQSWEIIQSYEDSRIRAIRPEKNTCCACFRETLKTLQGDYIAVAHCDDKWREDKLEKQVAYLDEHEEVSACFTNVAVIDEEGKEIFENNIYVEAFNKDRNNKYEWLNSLLYEGCGLCHPSILYRRGTYEKYGLNFTGLNSIPDYRKWIRLCALSDIHVIKEKLTYFRSRRYGGNTSGDLPEKHYRNVTEMFMVLREFLLVDDPNEFVKAFPYTEKFMIDGEMIIPFAFARLLLDTMNQPVYQLFALQLIYDLIQDDQIWNKVEKIYGYTLKDYNDEKQKYDIFSVIPNERFMQVFVYALYEKSDEWKEIYSNPKVYVNSYAEFMIEVDLNGSEEKISKLRFDIGKGEYRKYKDVRIILNDKEYFPERTTPHIVREEWQEFCTPFVYYWFDIDVQCEKVICTGKTEKVSMWEIEALINGEEVSGEMLYDAFSWYRKLVAEKGIWPKVKKLKHKILGNK